jgi:hypothetical protein
MTFAAKSKNQKTVLSYFAIKFLCSNYFCSKDSKRFSYFVGFKWCGHPSLRDNGVQERWG